MKKLIWLLALGLLMMLLESSLVMLPWLLIFFWLWGEKLSFAASLWIAVFLGILVDSLSLRVVGQSSLVLVIFVGGLWWLRRLFSGSAVTEWLFVLSSFLIWEWLFLEKFSWWVVVFFVISGGVRELRKRVGGSGEIRLR